LSGSEREFIEILQRGGTIKSTSFNHMKSIWMKAAPAARTDFSRTIFSWNRNGQSIQMSCPRKGTQVIQMADIISLAKLSISCLREKLDILIPEHANISLNEVQNNIDNLTDDPQSDKSFLFTQSGLALFSPLVTKLYDALYNRLHDEDKKPIIENINAWLGQEQDLLGALAFAFSWTSGYPARAFQTLDTRFKHDGSKKGNIFHISGLPILAWPKSKGLWRQGNQTSLWVLPHALRLPLYMYIAVIRQVQIKLMKELRQDTSSHQAYLFINSIGQEKKKNVMWTTAYLNGHVSGPRYLQGAFAFALDDRHMRQLAKSIVSQHLPYLLISKEASSQAGALPGFTGQGGHTA
jgi:hypothetical protein